MVWTKFPNQLNDLLKLRSALQVAAALSATDLRDDGIFGEALLRAGVVTTKQTAADWKLLPNSRQSHRTVARGLREMFILLGSMSRLGDTISLTAEGRLIAKQTGGALTSVERDTWITLLSRLRFPHKDYPRLSDGVTSVRPMHVLLAMLESGPVPAQGLTFAFSAKDETPTQVNTVKRRAADWSNAKAESLAREVGTTVPELRNNAKVFPGMLEQLGVIRRSAGLAEITPLGLALFGANASGSTATAAPVAPSTVFSTPAARPVKAVQNQAWVPKAIDPSDLSNRAQLRLIRAERASHDHQTTVRLMNDWLELHGFATTESDYDILAKRGSLWLLLEVKTIAAASIRVQVMRAIGQLAYYRSLSIKPPAGIVVRRGVVFDRPPADGRALKVLKDESIDVAWIDSGDVKFLDDTFRKLLERP